MNKPLRKALSCLLCLAMLFSLAVPALAVRTDDFFEEVVLDPALDLTDNPVVDAELLGATDESAEDEGYEIYPTPQSIVYNGDVVTLPATMKVVYGEGIDEYTVARAEDAFRQAGITLNPSASSSLTLKVSIKAADDGVTAGTANLFEKNGAYKLTVDETGVTVVGKDTDAAFYGLTTMKLILKQVKNRQVKALTVEDFADVPFRGFIEGYYGNPWSVEDRAELMRFGGDYKMNIYFYAPKDDPKHNSKWRELYTQEELDTLIKPLAEAGNQSKCYYGYALHPFWADGIHYGNDAKYEED